jgi:hypothetical protein
MNGKYTRIGMTSIVGLVGRFQLGEGDTLKSDFMTIENASPTVHAGVTSNVKPVGVF